MTTDELCQRRAEAIQQFLDDNHELFAIQEADNCEDVTGPFMLNEWCLMVTWRDIATVHDELRGAWFTPSMTHSHRVGMMHCALDWLES